VSWPWRGACTAGYCHSNNSSSSSSTRIAHFTVPFNTTTPLTHMWLCVSRHLLSVLSAYMSRPPPLPVDPDPAVKLSALSSLTHLVLGGMVKAKGATVEAICLSARHMGVIVTHAHRKGEMVLLVLDQTHRKSDRVFVMAVGSLHHTFMMLTHPAVGGGSSGSAIAAAVAPALHPLQQCLSICPIVAVCRCCCRPNPLDSLLPLSPFPPTPPPPSPPISPLRCLQHTHNTPQYPQSCQTAMQHRPNAACRCRCHPNCSSHSSLSSATPPPPPSSPYAHTHKHTSMSSVSSSSASASSHCCCVSLLLSAAAPIAASVRAVARASASRGLQKVVWSKAEGSWS